MLNGSRKSIGDLDASRKEISAIGVWLESETSKGPSPAETGKEVFDR